MRLRKLKEDINDSEVITLEELLPLFLPYLQEYIDKEVTKKLEMQNKPQKDPNEGLLVLPFRIPPNIKDNVCGIVADSRDGKLKAYINNKWSNIKLE